MANRSGSEMRLAIDFGFALLAGGRDSFLGSLLRYFIMSNEHAVWVCGDASRERFQSRVAPTAPGLARHLGLQDLLLSVFMLTGRRIGRWLSRPATAARPMHCSTRAENTLYSIDLTTLTLTKMDDCRLGRALPCVLCHAA